jgi:acyl-CoA thioesterase FadM
MTGTLVVRYRRPTPLHTPLRFTAEYLRSEGRKLYTEARVHAGNVLCAEAEGIFVSIARERFAELESERAAREADRAR